MAQVAPADGRRPPALAYLVANKLLPPDHLPSAYTWQVYGGLPGEADDELVTTNCCVVWSRDGAIRRVLRFEPDTKNPSPRTALLTTFSSFSSTTTLDTKGQRRTLRHGVSSSAPTRNDDRDGDDNDARRALCVIADGQIQIYFFNGPSYTVRLPFDINHVVPMHQGLLLERRQTPSRRMPDPWSHSLGSRTANAWSTIDGPTLFSLTNPVAGVCPIMHIATTPRSRPSLPYDPGLPTDYGDMHRGHQLVCATSLSPRLASTALVFTASQGSDQLTVWQTWKIASKRASSVMALRDAYKMSQSTRRSSVFTTNNVTAGTSTPNFRREQEALKGYAASAQPTHDPVAARRRTRKSRSRPSEEPDVGTLASQLDSQPRPTQNLTKTSRRMSSLAAKTDLNITDPFATTTIGHTRSTRRGPSTGTARERQSLGASKCRKSRGSTITSLLAPSFETSQHDMDLDLAEDMGPSRYEIEQLASMTGPPGNIELALNTSVDGPSHDLIARRLQTLPLPTLESSHGSDVQQLHKVTSLALQESDTLDNDRRIALLFVLNIRTHQLLRFDVRPNTAASNPSMPAIDPPVSLLHQETLDGCLDLISCRDGPVAATACLLDDRSLRIFSSAGISWSISLTTLIQPLRPQADTRGDFVTKLRLAHASSNGTFDLCGVNETRHRVQIRLRPRGVRLQRVLDILRHALGAHEGAAILRIWTLTMLDSGAEVDDDAHEWEALVLTMFSFAVGSLQPPPVKSGALRNDMVSPNKNRGESTPLRPHWDWLLEQNPEFSEQHRPRSSRQTSMAEFEARARHNLPEIAVEDLAWLKDKGQDERRSVSLRKVMFAAHLFMEEDRLSTLTASQCDYTPDYLLPAVAQIGIWLRMPAWGWQTDSYYLLQGDGRTWQFSDANSSLASYAHNFTKTSPPSVFAWFESALDTGLATEYPTLDEIARGELYPKRGIVLSNTATRLLPRTTALQRFIALLSESQSTPQTIVEALDECGLAGPVLSSFPESISAPCREASTRCRADPPPHWSKNLVQFVGREDLVQCLYAEPGEPGSVHAEPHDTTRSIQTVYQAVERAPLLNKTDEVERHKITHLLFPEDRRFIDARDLLNSMNDQVAECPPEPFWSEAQHLEHQKRMLHFVVTRTIALPAGDAMVRFSSQRLLLSEKMQFPDFKTKCLMKPMNIIRVPDTASFSEEKTGWAFFHAGVSRGLHISREALGIETSWIAFNKPAELTHRHAGLLFALGLTGRLCTLAKWLTYDYLRAKHTMTSVGLLLGLASSHMGTMDTLITQTLSLHVMRMLPYGAAPLNVPTIAQTAALMGLGLVYCNTQHRRMTEVMLSELEHREVEEPGSNLDAIQEESYRLAAGFALGYINLGQGGNLHGLHGMGLLERLLALAVGTRPIELVYVIDKAIPAAVISIALIYMKTGDRSIARKVDVPNAFSQLDHVRPDVLLLRVLAKNLIMWDDIEAKPGWIRNQFSKDFTQRFYGAQSAGRRRSLPSKVRLTSANVPFYNMLAGFAWSLSLKYAGSGNVIARDEILACLDLLHDISKEEAYYYDAILARNTVRRCIDLVALAAATVMAGTGDLPTFRYLRRLHGRIDAVTTYGSHMAAHLAIGALFLGGGTFTFGTSNLAIASLVCAFYPMFPADTSHNGAHLQALRHVWVFAAEPRCIVVKDIDSRRAVCIDLEVKMRDGRMINCRSPCLLPELNTIASVKTADPAYWQIRLDFADKGEHLKRFEASQIVYVRQRSAHEAGRLLFNSTLASLNEGQSSPTWRQMWRWLFDLDAFRKALGRPDMGLVLGPVGQNAISIVDSGTVIDDSLALMTDANSKARDALWNLRLLFAWAQKASVDGGDVEWIGKFAMDALRSEIERRLSGYSGGGPKLTRPDAR